MGELKHGVFISKEVYQNIYPTVILSRMFGFFPVRVIKRTSSYQLVWSSTFFVISFILVVALVSTAVYGLSEVYKIKIIGSIRLAETSGTICTILENLCLFCTFVLGTFLTPFRFKYVWTYLDSVDKVGLLLGRQHTNESKRNMVVTSVTLGITLGVLVLDFLLWSKVATKDIPRLEYLGKTIAFYVTYVYVMIRELYFWTLMDTIRSRITSLNDVLLDILKEKDNSIGQHEYINQKLVKIVHDTKNVVNIRNGVAEERTCFKKLIMAHGLLFDASAAAENHLGIFNLIILLGCLIHMLVTPYDLYLQIKHTGDYAFIGGQVIWMLGHVLRLIFFIEPCQACRNEIQRTVATACKILQTDLQTEARMQLTYLLKQMDQCRIQFSACGLVNIDRTLLTAVTGTVTTYLVILFQFK